MPMNEYGEIIRNSSPPPPIQTSNNGGNSTGGPTNKSRSGAYIIVGIVILIIVIFAITRVLSNDSHSANNENYQNTSNGNAVYQQNDQSNGNQSIEYKVDEAVSNYLEAFIKDINAGHYNSLYSAVVVGSNMESIQKKFIENTSNTEQLLKYSIENIQIIDDWTCYATAVEDYDVWQNKEPYHFFISQRCVYMLNKQQDGSWLVSDFVGNVEVVNKQEY